MSIFRNLFNFEEIFRTPETTSVIFMDKPSKKAEKKREAKIAAAKAKLGDKYLAVPFKKAEAVKELPPEIPRIGKERKVKTA